MTIQELEQKTDRIFHYLSQKQLKNALDGIRSLISELNDWNTTAELENIETTYKYMLQYMLSGAEDPDRETVYANLLRATYALADKANFLLREKYDYRYYYQNRRNMMVSLLPDYRKLADSLQDTATKISLSDLLEDMSSTSSVQHQKELENQSIQLFRYIWLNCDLNEAEFVLIEGIVCNRSIPCPYRALLVSALFLSLQENFDEEKIRLLFNLYEWEEEEISQRALVVLLLILYRYDKRLFLYPQVKNRLSHLMEDPSFVNHVNTIIKQFILSKETEKISRKITEELLPEMMKVSPKISEKINFSELMDMDGIDDKNPEWQSLLEEAGLTDKLQEMSELQMEGADVMHSSFSNLKVFPFFYEFSNWFLPFHARHSMLATSAEEDGILEVLSEMSYICNSDKYSLCFSLQQMPGQYRGTMMKQILSETTEYLKQQKEDSLVPEEKRRETVSNQYLHDLYRFFKVHPRRAEFEDIFASSFAFYQTNTVGSIIADEKSLRSIGEYYFSKNQYQDARNVFDRLAVMDPEDAVLFQKIGYCKQMEGDLEGALAEYLKSDLMVSGNTWTIRKIASCYRFLKQPDKALEYYRKVEILLPENLSLQLSIGHCYLELRQYNEALQTYFKVEYLNSRSTKAWRPIAWCSFLTGKFEQSIHYYEKIVKLQPEMSDYLNCGHAFLATKDIQRATEMYRKAILAKGSSQEKFFKDFEADVPELIQAGIEKTELPIVLDQVLYSFEN